MLIINICKYKSLKLVTIIHRSDRFIPDLNMLGIWLSYHFYLILCGTTRQIGNKFQVIGYQCTYFSLLNYEQWITCMHALPCTSNFY